LERDSLQDGNLERIWRDFGFWREIVSRVGP